MKIEEAAALLDGMLNYWPNILRGNDPEAMARAWAVALDDIPLRVAKMAAADLARTLKFPPTVYELAQAATQYMNPQQKWDELFSVSCHECLGWDTPLYQRMCAEKERRDV